MNMDRNEQKNKEEQQEEESTTVKYIKKNYRKDWNWKEMETGRIVNLGKEKEGRK